jgi:hypothetical protein
MPILRKVGIDPGTLDVMPIHNLAPDLGPAHCSKRGLAIVGFLRRRHCHGRFRFVWWS